MFHVNIITASGVMTITFYKALTRNPEIGNDPVCVLPNIWRLGPVKNNKFDTNVSNKIITVLPMIGDLLSSLKLLKSLLIILQTNM